MTPIKNAFAGALFNSTDAMLAGIAEEYFTAGGMNDAETVREIAADMTPERAADDCIESWALDQAPDFPDLSGPQSHMDLNDYTRADLVEAMRAYMEKVKP